ncbi:MAG: hypothetical protein QM749_17405 [Aquabacterium sp.]
MRRLHRPRRTTRATRGRQPAAGATTTSKAHCATPATSAPDGTRPPRRDLNERRLPSEDERSRRRRHEAPKRGRWTTRAGGIEHWVKPQMVVEVAFADWTPDGTIRHAAFLGVRTDKPAAIGAGRESPCPPTRRRPDKATPVVRQGHAPRAA